MSARKTTAKSGSGAAVVAEVEAPFAEVVGLIEQARPRAYQTFNTERVGLYWRIGEYISGKLAAADWGERARRHGPCIAQHAAPASVPP